MKENKEKSEAKNSLLSWYQEVPRTKKTKFILALQIKFGLSASGVYDKIKKNNWRPYEREMVDEVINDGTWEQ